MRALSLVLCLFFGQAASAQVIGVASGEHSNFSRLVFSFPNPVEWSFTRTETGYALSTPGAGARYDLSDVYRRIGTERLEAIEFRQGALMLTLDCDCYAMPFELRSGILVIDLKDGSAPEGSSFELAADGTLRPPLRKRVATSGRPQAPPPPALSTQPGALEAALEGASRHPTSDTPIAARAAPAGLEQIRADLLMELSKGAAQGIVDVSDRLVVDPNAATVPKVEQATGSDNIKIGDRIDPSAAKRAADHMTGVGMACIPDARLDIATWGDADQIPSQFSENTTDLLGEFDRPDEDAVARSVRYNLALGFGAEARQILNALKVSLPDRKIWETMSYIMDLEIPPGTVFQGMEVCDSMASLWAALAMADLPPTNQIAIPAILRNFSSLPLHLRRHLGPELANRFLARDDAVTARAVRDAILRAPGDKSASLKLLEAEIDLANGDIDAAEASLTPLAGTTGPVGVKSALMLIQTQIDLGQEVPFDATTAAEALLSEAMGGQDEGVLRDALALAYASQNRYDDAFNTLRPSGRDATPIWTLLAAQGGNDAVIEFAIFASSEDPPQLPAATEQQLARRLLDLGFPDPATRWLQSSHRRGEGALVADALLVAEAAIVKNDGITALSQLEGLEGETADMLRAKALRSLQSPDAIGQLVKIGQDEDAARTARAQNAWVELAQLSQGDIWQEAANLLAAPSVANESVAPEGTGPLALSRAALEESKVARDILERLILGQEIP